MSRDPLGKATTRATRPVRQKRLSDEGCPPQLPSKAGWDYCVALANRLPAAGGPDVRHCFLDACESEDDRLGSLVVRRDLGDQARPVEQVLGELDRVQG